MTFVGSMPDTRVATFCCTCLSHGHASVLNVNACKPSGMMSSTIYQQWDRHIDHHHCSLSSTNCQREVGNYGAGNDRFGQKPQPFRDGATSSARMTGAAQSPSCKGAEPPIRPVMTLSVRCPTLTPLMKEPQSSCRARGDDWGQVRRAEWGSQFSRSALHMGKWLNQDVVAAPIIWCLRN
jgi:hypothetical protein